MKVKKNKLLLLIYIVKLSLYNEILRFHGGHTVHIFPARIYQRNGII